MNSPRVKLYLNRVSPAFEKNRIIMMYSPVETAFYLLFFLCAIKGE